MTLHERLTLENQILPARWFVAVSRLPRREFEVLLSLGNTQYKFWQPHMRFGVRIPSQYPENSPICLCQQA